MFRRRGVILIKLALVSLWLLAAPLAQAISVGNLTFSLASDDEFAAKRVLNNNKSARLYRVSLIAIDRPAWPGGSVASGGRRAAVRPAPADAAGGRKRVL